ncbi:MAG: putative ABC transporter permease, partial [Oscillospiraceae bacterium]
QNRTGLVYGPFNLIYGFGALLMTLTMWWLRKERDIAMFFCGAVLGSVYEFFCSWLQETVLGTVSWEYSEMPFNLYGRINLLYSLFWGILALAWVKGIYPLMSKWIEKIPKKYGYPLTWILIIFMVFNSAVSGLAVWRMTERNENIPANNVVMEYFDEKFPDERVQKVYPSMQYVEKTDKK